MSDEGYPAEVRSHAFRSAHKRYPREDLKPNRLSFPVHPSTEDDHNMDIEIDAMDKKI